MKSLSRRRVFTFGSGVLVALVILFTQLSYVQTGDHQDPSIDTEQETPSSDQQFTSLPSSFSMPSAHVVLSHEFTFIEELLLGSEQPETIPVGIQLFTGKLFRTLFKFIISPNAP